MGNAGTEKNRIYCGQKKNIVSEGTSEEENRPDLHTFLCIVSLITRCIMGRESVMDTVMTFLKLSATLQFFFTFASRALGSTRDLLCCPSPLWRRSFYL